MTTAGLLLLTAGRTPECALGDDDLLEDDFNDGSLVLVLFIVSLIPS